MKQMIFVVWLILIVIALIVSCQSQMAVSKLPEAQQNQLNAAKYLDKETIEKAQLLANQNKTNVDSVKVVAEATRVAVQTKIEQRESDVELYGPQITAIKENAIEIATTGLFCGIPLLVIVFFLGIKVTSK